MSSVPLYPFVPNISLELTNRCNLKCPYCGNRNLTRPRGEIDWAFLEKLVDECRGGRYNIAWLHGTGEPLLYRRLEDAVRLIKENDAGAASFGTNGTLLTGDRVRSLLDAGLDAIYISLDSLNPEVYRKTRGADLGGVVRNIKELLRIVPDSFQVTIALMQSKVQKLGPRARAEFDSLFGTHKNVCLNPVENTLFPASDTDYQVHRSMKTYCTMPRNFFTVVYDGRVQLCCVDQDVQGCLGDLTKQDIRQVWFARHTQDRFEHLALGEQGAPAYCQKKCRLVVENMTCLSRQEVDTRRVNRLLQQAAGMFQQARYPDCVPFLHRIIEIMPGHAIALDMLGTIAMQNKHFKHAAGFFERALNSEPHNKNYFFHCALAYEAMGQLRPAISCYERTLALEPEFKAASDRLMGCIKLREQQRAAG